MKPQSLAAGPKATRGAFALMTATGQLEVLEAHGCKGEGGLPGRGSAGARGLAVGYSEVRLANNSTGVKYLHSDLCKMSIQWNGF